MLASPEIIGICMDNDGAAEDVGARESLEKVLFLECQATSGHCDIAEVTRMALASPPRRTSVSRCLPFVPMITCHCTALTSQVPRAMYMKSVFARWELRESGLDDETSAPIRKNDIPFDGACIKDGDSLYYCLGTGAGHPALSSCSLCHIFLAQARTVGGPHSSSVRGLISRPCLS